MSDTTGSADPETLRRMGRQASSIRMIMAAGGTIIGLSILGVVFFTSQQTNAEIQTTNVANLPAIEARLASVEAEIELERGRNESLTEQVATLTAQLAGTPSSDSVQQEFDDFQQQLDRRDAEQSSDLDATVVDLNGDIAVMRDVMGELEADLEFLERVTGFGSEPTADAGG